MSEPAREGMAVATASEPDEPKGIGTLPAEYRAALQLRKEMNVAAALVAQQNWGKTLDLPTRRAITDFCRTYQIDPATELHVLGGNVYVNAAFYLRKLGEMQAAGEIEYAVADYIHKDARLDEMEQAGNAKAAAENARRKWERIAFDVDDAAVTACVFRVKTPRMTHEVTGCKAVYAESKDPVGNAFPMESAETRAVRRAMRKLASHVTAGAGQLVEIGQQAERISVQLTQYRDKLKQRGPDELEDSAPVFRLGSTTTLRPGGGGRPLTPEDGKPHAPELNERGEQIPETVVVHRKAPSPDQTAEDRALDLELMAEERGDAYEEDA